RADVIQLAKLVEELVLQPPVGEVLPPVAPQRSEIHEAREQLLELFEENDQREERPPPPVDGDEVLQQTADAGMRRVESGDEPLVRSRESRARAELQEPLDRRVLVEIELAFSCRGGLDGAEVLAQAGEVARGPEQAAHIWGERRALDEQGDATDI